MQATIFFIMGTEFRRGKFVSIHREGVGDPEVILAGVLKDGKFVPGGPEYLGQVLLEHEQVKGVRLVVPRCEGRYAAERYVTENGAVARVVSIPSKDGERYELVATGPTLATVEQVVSRVPISPEDY